MAEMNPEQAMMQGAMQSAMQGGMPPGGGGMPPGAMPPGGMPPGAMPPEAAAAGMTNLGDETAEERAGQGEDTILGHLTVGEIVLPVDIVDNELAMRKIQSLFEKYDLNVNQYTVGHEDNSINPETGNPEFGVFSSFTGSKQRKKAEKAGRKAAQEEAFIQYQRIKRMKKRFKRKMRKGKRMLLKEAEESKRTFAAESMISRKRFEERSSEVAKEIADVGQRPGIAEGAEESREGALVDRTGVSNWRKRTRRPRGGLPRRPQ